MKVDYIGSIGKTNLRDLSPVLKCFYFLVDDGEQVLVDVEGKDYKEITQHVKTILGKSE